jgi:hypothetical protein
MSYSFNWDAIECFWINTIEETWRVLHNQPPNIIMTFTQYYRQVGALIRFFKRKALPLTWGRKIILESFVTYSGTGFYRREI